MHDSSMQADDSRSSHATPIKEGLPSVLMLWRGTAWDGEFVQIGNLTRSNGPGEPQWSWVDPTVWLDRRGNIHIVANMGYGTFRLNFHHFNRIELGLRGRTHVRGADVSCLRLKSADLVLI